MAKVIKPLPVSPLSLYGKREICKQVSTPLDSRAPEEIRYRRKLIAYSLMSESGVDCLNSYGEEFSALLGTAHSKYISRVMGLVGYLNLDELVNASAINRLNESITELQSLPSNKDRLSRGIRRIGLGQKHMKLYMAQLAEFFVSAIEDSPRPSLPGSPFSLSDILRDGLEDIQSAEENAKTNRKVLALLGRLRPNISQAEKDYSDIELKCRTDHETVENTTILASTYGLCLMEDYGAASNVLEPILTGEVRTEWQFQFYAQLLRTLIIIAQEDMDLAQTAVGQMRERYKLEDIATLTQQFPFCFFCGPDKAKKFKHTSIDGVDGSHARRELKTFHRYQQSGDHPVLNLAKLIDEGIMVLSDELYSYLNRENVEKVFMKQLSHYLLTHYQRLGLFPILIDETSSPSLVERSQQYDPFVDLAAQHFMGQEINPENAKQFVEEHYKRVNDRMNQGGYVFLVDGDLSKTPFSGSPQRFHQGLSKIIAKGNCVVMNSTSYDSLCKPA